MAWKYENASNKIIIIETGAIFNWCTGKDGVHHPSMWTVHAANTCTADRSAANKVKRAVEINQAKSSDPPKGDKPQLQPNKKLQAALLVMDKTLNAGADSSDDEYEKHF